MRKHIKLLSIILFSLLIAVFNGCENNQMSTATDSSKEKSVEVKEKDEIKDTNEGNISEQADLSQTEQTPSVQAKEGANSTDQQAANTPKGESPKSTITKPSKPNSESNTAPSSPAVQSPKVEEKKEEKPVTPPVEEKKPENLLTVSTVIKGPKDVGTIAGSTTVEVKEGATILDVLLLVAKNKGIMVGYTGNGPTAYVEGIHNIYEFDYGPKSGWTCQRNGVTLDRSADAIQVKNGDHIDWIYKED
ncbi:DUF4430 domain-containing protein [Bacillus suaedaesalsae]|uniref:DUF4430 domain-containing protein n=1 Tax=Bacillus suaedaesalsae TaxID=2810349 RepID=A0ABS2DN32_9BACI|nr:DUF4430 domain-containing protein [Bacillus suaedaesalsae]MBM6619914.1 DUF4430 domain-containing protein [Bacillus suaedaesalsae]